MRLATASLALLVLSLSHVGDGAEGPALPIVTKVEQQPLVSQVERLVQSLDILQFAIEQDGSRGARMRR